MPKEEKKSVSRKSYYERKLEEETLKEAIVKAKELLRKFRGN